MKVAWFPYYAGCLPLDHTLLNKVYHCPSYTITSSRSPDSRDHVVLPIGSSSGVRMTIGRSIKKRPEPFQSPTMQPAPSNCMEKTLPATSEASKPQPERATMCNFLESLLRRPQRARLTRVLKALLPKERQTKGTPRAVVSEQFSSLVFA